LKKDPELRRRLSEAARDLFIRKYDRAVIVPQIISKIVGGLSEYGSIV
jgi:hypothetical protein